MWPRMPKRIGFHAPRLLLFMEAGPGLASCGFGCPDRTCLLFHSHDIDLFHPQETRPALPLDVRQFRGVYPGLWCYTHHGSVDTLAWTYWLSGAIKVVTAIASVPTAILLVQLVPHELALPSPEAMKVEIAERKRTEQALQQAKNELELKVLERTAELRKSEAELRTIVETIPGYVGINLPDGNVDFVSQSWLDYTGLPGRSGWAGAGRPLPIPRTSTAQ